MDTCSGPSLPSPDPEIEFRPVTRNLIGVIVMGMNSAQQRLVLMAVGGAVILAVGMYRDSRRQRQSRRLLKERPARSHAEFGREFFPEKFASLAAEVREALADALHQDLSGLLPTDELGATLKLDTSNYKALLRVIAALEDRFQVDLPHGESCAALSIRQLVDHIAAKSRRPEGHSRDT